MAKMCFFLNGYVSGGDLLRFYATFQVDCFFRYIFCVGL